MGKIASLIGTAVIMTLSYIGARIILSKIDKSTMDKLIHLFTDPFDTKS